LGPDSNSTKEFQFFKQMATEWKAKMERAHLTHNDMFFSLRSSILCKLAYPLVVSNFSQHQCYEIMKPILQVGLPKIGCMCTMLREIVHALHELLGLSVPNLYTKQLITQLTMLLCYRPQPKETTGMLIQAAAELIQLEVGLSGDIMVIPGLFEPVITDTWLKWLWMDCLQYCLNIQTDLPKFAPHCSQDIELVLIFAQHGYRGQDLCALNCCRMFLQAIWVSDISNGTGKEILKEAWDGTEKMELQYQWPQTVIESQDWSLWQ